MAIDETQRPDAGTSATPFRTFRPASIWLVWGLATAALHGLAVWNAAPPNDDFETFYVAATSLVRTGSPYALAPDDLGLDCEPFAYPPALAYALSFFTPFPVALATTWWKAANLALTVFLAWLIARAVAGSRTRARETILALGALCSLYPQMIGTTLGQVHTLIACLVVGGYLLLRSGADLRAGVLIGLATVTKLFPGLLIVALLALGRLRAAAAATATLVVFILATPAAHLAYLRDHLVSGSIPLPLASQHMISLPAMARRLFRDTAFAEPVLASPALEWAAVGGCAALVGLGLWAILRRTRELKPIYLAFACAMLLASPGIGVYHLNLVLPVALCAVIFPLASGDLVIRWDRRTAAFAAGLALAAIPVEYGLTGSAAGWAGSWLATVHTGWGVLLLTPQTYGLALVFGLVVSSATWKPHPRDRRDPAAV